MSSSTRKIGVRTYIRVNGTFRNSYLSSYLCHGHLVMSSINQLIIAVYPRHKDGLNATKESAPKQSGRAVYNKTKVT